ncbi:MAG TPA: T9SS type A sorting domain-containing protein [Ignavibacteria bacterium]|nr:T9SS type A sorting domain-containing protein [Ignavibacteria bacterium]HMR42154.1 T9SS type A sorting domain-containing protein [Ignavibacteria bacterium]
MKNLIKIIFVLSFLLPVCAQGQAVTWQKIFGGPLNDFARVTLQTKDGNILMLGEKIVLSLQSGLKISQTYLVKFNMYGQILWTKNIGDSIKPNAPTSAIEMPSGNILITYLYNDRGNLMKVDPDGNIIWDYSYKHPISGFYCISLLNNFKNIIINGDMVGGMSYIYATFKLDTNGNLIWKKSYDDASYTGYYNTESGFYSVGLKSWDTTIINKKDTSGNLIWTKIFSNNGNFFRLLSIAPISNSTFLAIGNISIPSQYNYGGLYITKFDSSGNLYWNKNYLSDSLNARKIVRSNNNKFAITGGQGEPIGKLCIVDSTGNLLTKKFYSYNSKAIIDYDGIINYSDSGFIISGSYVYSPSDFDYNEFLVIKTDKELNFNPVNISNNDQTFLNKDFKLTTYPNPFNPELNVKITSNKKRTLKLQIFNSTGKEFVSIDYENVEIGTSIIKLKSNELGLSSGIYFLKVSDLEYSILNKIVFLK